MLSKNISGPDFTLFEIQLFFKKSNYVHCLFQMYSVNRFQAFNNSIPNALFIHLKFANYSIGKLQNTQS